MKCGVLGAEKEKTTIYRYTHTSSHLDIGSQEDNQL